jgi:hypothetical protein
MDKKKHEPVHVAPPKPPEPTSCAVCGGNDGDMVSVVGHIRAHAQCAAARPDVIAKVKARA